MDPSPASKSEKSMLTKAVEPTKGNTCCQFITNVTMMVFFGIYAFNNPDGYSTSSDNKDNCYAFKTSSTGSEMLVSPTMPDDTVEYHDLLNVGYEYHVIFILYFCLCILNVLYTSTAAHYFFYHNKNVLICNSVLVCLSGASTLAWMVYASIINFGEHGQACDDADLLSKSGMFIKVWLILLYCGLGVLCCIACMMMCIVNNNRKKAKRNGASGVDEPLRQ